MNGSLQTTFEVALEPSAAFTLLVEELFNSLARAGLRFESGPGGRVVQGNFELARVVSWEPGKRIRFQWHPADWVAGESTEVELRFEPIEGGTRVVLEHRGWGRLVGGPEELLGRYAGAVAVPFLRAATPTEFGDWFTDRKARRPSGRQSRETYRRPLYHLPNFRVILAELGLRSHDYLLEVGCGGGAFLNQALRTGCRAAAVDHSAEMVALTQEVNAAAVAEGRLIVAQADASQLPFPNESFTCAVMTGILGFLPDPVEALKEIHRVLAAGGRLVVLGSDPALRGTPAAPEPMASRLHFYDSKTTECLAREAGFTDAQVVLRPLDAFAKEAGVPEAHLPLFSGPGAPFLLAKKSPSLNP